MFNQLCDIGLENFSETVSAAYHEYGICKFTANVGDKICIYSGGINGTYAANGAYVAGFIGETYIEFWGKQIVQVTGMVTASYICDCGEMETHMIMFLPVLKFSI